MHGKETNIKEFNLLKVSEGENGIKGVNWIYEGEIAKHERVPFNQNTRLNGKLSLKYIAKIKLGTQLFESSNVLIRIPDTFKKIFKQAEEKGYDFRKYISVSVEYPHPWGAGIKYETKKYNWNEIQYKYGDTILLQVPMASFLVLARFTTDITFNYGDLIRDADIVPNNSVNDEMDFTWTTNILDWTVIGDKKTHVSVNPLVIGNSIEKPTINAENKIISVGDKFDPLEGVTAFDGHGKPIDVVVKLNTVDSSNPGIYIVVYFATDIYGNGVEKGITVTVKAKNPTEKPIIYAENKIINIGDEFDPKNGVYAIDSEGHVLDVNIEANTVDVNTPGSYIVIYSAIDKYGNEAQKHITVTVKAKNPEVKPKIYAENKTINVGDEFDPKKDVYATDSEGLILQVDVEVNTVDINTPGSYIVVYSATDRHGNKAKEVITVTVKVKDPTEKPTIYAENQTINVGDEFDPKKDVYAIDSEGHVLDVNIEANTVDVNMPGNYIVVYSAIDKYGNRAEKPIIVIVKAPTEKPTIYAEDKIIQVGDKFDPLEGVSATDAKGNPIEVVVELNTVNPDEPGKYEVKYSATDKYGNRAEKSITVTVIENKDYSITANDFNIDSDTYLTGDVGKDVAKIEIEINGKILNVVEPNVNGGYRAYVRSYITSVNDIVKAISLDKDERKKEFAMAKLIYNNVILSAEDYTIGEDRVVRGKVDERATKVVLYDTDENAGIRQGKINTDGTYEISAVDIITSKSKNYAVVAFEGNTELKRVVVNVKESNNDYILTAK
ncbi:hypothetical protein CN353_24470, partial [Bacillus cereus]|uniref:immunoglobulin-like domain-containing protein n=1 Tax=Bacillus cereus TaxID=1396 RepID=UPI000BFAD807